MQLQGKQLNRYRIIDEIGKGGMGEVYQAIDTHISRKVAIKVIRSTGEATKGSFQHEMEAIGKLDHQHILTLYDYGEEQVKDEGTIYYMIMPLCQEGSLKKWQEEWQKKHSNRCLPLNLVAHFIQQAAHALQYAHDNQIIHRDVKPHNFLIRTNTEHPDLPDLLLADFGVAKFTTTTPTTLGRHRGTPHYMAPESWDTRSVRNDQLPLIDQYALAITAYELLTGRYPFEGGLYQLMFQHMQTVPDPPGKYNRNIPEAIDKVILRALKKQPAHRFPSVAAFADAFLQAVQNLTPGNPIHLMLAITETEAMFGTRYPLTLPGPGSPNRKVTVLIPKGTQNGQEIRLDRQGHPSPHGGPNGPLIITITVKPSNKHDEVIKQLNSLSKDIRGLNSPINASPISPSGRPGSRRATIWLLYGIQILLVTALFIASFGYFDLLNQFNSIKRQIDILTSPTPITCGAFSDEFNGNLHSGWEWYNPRGNATYKIEQNSLSISISAVQGQNNDLWESDTYAPRLLRPTNGNFIVQVTVDFTQRVDSSKGYQGTGILIWQDEHHFLRLERGNDPQGYLLATMGRNMKENGSSAYWDQLLGTGTAPSSVALKIQRVSNTITIYWREPDQNNWQTTNSFDFPLSNVRVGLDLVNGASNTPITASYQHFIVSCG